MACRHTPIRFLISLRLEGRVESEHRDFPACPRAQSFQNFDGGSLPCAVRSEQSEDFAPADFEIDSADSLKIAIGFVQVCTEIASESFI